jgi:hypothetical protein
MDADVRPVTVPMVGVRRAVALDWSRIDAGRVLLVVLAAWAIAMIVPDAYRVFGSLGSFGLVVNNDGVVIDTVGPFTTPAASPAAAAGIAIGDRVDLRAMRCVPIRGPRCRSLLRLIGGLGGPQVVRPHSAVDLIIQPAAGGAAKTVRLEATRTTRSWGDRLVLLADTIVGVVVILAACRLVWLRPGAMTWGFFLYAMWFNPGQTFAYYAMLQPWPIAIFVQEIAEALAHGAGYAGLLIFALCFPFGSPRPAMRRYERIALGIGVAIAALWLASFSNAFGEHTETLTSLAFLLGYALDAIVVFILVRRRHALPPPDRQRMVWVICGCAIGLPAFIFAEIAQSTSLLQHALGLSMSNVVIGLVYLVNGVLVYFVSVAVLRRRVVSVSIPLRYGTILSALSLAVGVPIVNLHELLSHYQGSFRIPEWIWLLVIAPIALVLLQRLHELGVKLVDRLLNRRFHAAHRQFDEAGAAMLAAQRFEEIDRLLVSTAVRALRLSSGAAFREENGVFRRVFAIEWDASQASTLAAEHDADALQSIARRAPVRLQRTQWDGPDAAAKLRDPCIAVPVVGDVLGPVGIALLGAHQNGNDIDADEREMLAEFGRRAAAGYERAAFVMLREEVTDLRSRLSAAQERPPEAAPRPT